MVKLFNYIGNGIEFYISKENVSLYIIIFDVIYKLIKEESIYLYENKVDIGFGEKD